MSYFTAATKGLDITAGRRKQTEQLFRDANAAWIELTDIGYELSILGELHSISFSLEDATQELNTAILRGPSRGFPDSLEIMYLGGGVWGVDVADLARRTRAALESL